MLKKILITGGAGYIGSHTVLTALEQGYEVAVVDNLSTGNRKAVPSQVTFYEEDVANSVKIIEILQDFQPDAVIHFAGSIIVPESIENPIKYYQNNTVASLGFIEACVKSGIDKIIFSSTAAVYGQPSVDIVTEDTPTQPINPYGYSKLMVEQFLSDIAKAHDINYTVLRYFNVAGADRKLRTGQSTPKATHLIKVACQAALGIRPTIDVFGTDYDTPDGTCIRDYIHVVDLAEAHLKALERMVEGSARLVLNCGNGKGYSVKEVLEAVECVTNVKLNIHYTERRKGDPAVLVASPDVLNKTIGWCAKYTDIDEIISDAFRWEKFLLEAPTAW